MNSAAWKSVAMAIVMALAVIGHVEAQLNRFSATARLPQLSRGKWLKRYRRPKGKQTATGSSRVIAYRFFCCSPLMRIPPHRTTEVDHAQLSRRRETTHAKEKEMNSAAWKSVAMAIVMALAVIGHVEAQQYQQPHKGAQLSQEQVPETLQDPATQTPMMQQMQGMMGQMQGMMQQMHGMMQQMDRGMGRGRMMADADDEDDEDDISGRRGRMGRGRMMGWGRMMGHGGSIGHTRMMQHTLDHLTQQLNLSDEQQTKVKVLWRTRAKDAIQLQADIEMASIDLHQLLEAESVEMGAVKAALQAMAAKEVELHVAHISAMLDMRQLLTPEQQQQFHTVWGHMMHGRGGMMGHSGMRQHGKMMDRGGMKGPRGMRNPCSAPRGNPNN